ncbi:MAG: N-acetyltransferase [Methylobacterium sp.]|nr:N-acetyltransferase [Methylobacterium sp.]
MIRPANEADLAAITAIFNEVILNSTAIYADEPVDIADRAGWFEARRAAGYPVLVAEAGGEVIGFASFGDWRGAWSGYRHSVEHSVHVRADRRGRGAGSAMVAALFPLARDLGKHVMIGGIDAENAASIAMHQRLGFARVAHFREVGRKFDRWLDLVFMQRFLALPAAP